MSKLLNHLRDRLGVVSLAALALFCVSLLMLVLLVRPLESRLSDQERRIHEQSRANRSQGIRNIDPRTQLNSFYGYFNREEDISDWLAKLYGAATASGIDFGAAKYRMTSPGGRLNRYQISIPVSGSHAQIQRFIGGAVADIPVISLDQMTLRRKRAADARLEAELAFTLYLLKP
ncbi:MAG: hypothetical protein IPK29_15295 [Betaproteobacteria bacterium]|nr:hypothetical protein [Betaproteobacteria bacterium]